MNSFRYRFKQWLLLMLMGIAGMTGCDQAGKTAHSPVQTPPIVAKNAASVTSEMIEAADYSVLFIGNSHCYEMPTVLTRLFHRQDPETKTVIVRALNTGFLDMHSKSQLTLELLQRGPWDVVVLQAQKYSSSGMYHYPVDGCLKLSKLASENGSQLIMYPEWSRRGQPEEYHRINRLHDSIAEQTGAIVAPVGQSWEQAMGELPDVDLYATDGNHCNQDGAFLTGCVIFSMLTGEPGKPPEQDPDFDSKTRLAEIAISNVREADRFLTRPTK